MSAIFKLSCSSQVYLLYIIYKLTDLNTSITNSTSTSIFSADRALPAATGNWNYHVRFRIAVLRCLVQAGVFNFYFGGLQRSCNIMLHINSREITVSFVGTIYILCRHVVGLFLAYVSINGTKNQQKII